MTNNLQKCPRNIKYKIASYLRFDDLENLFETCDLWGDLRKSSEFYYYLLKEKYPMFEGLEFIWKILFKNFGINRKLENKIKFRLLEYETQRSLKRSFLHKENSMFCVSDCQKYINELFRILLKRECRELMLKNINDYENGVPIYYIYENVVYIEYETGEHEINFLYLNINDLQTFSEIYTAIRFPLLFFDSVKHELVILADEYVLVIDTKISAPILYKRLLLIDDPFIDNKCYDIHKLMTDASSIHYTNNKIFLENPTFSAILVVQSGLFILSNF